MKLLKNSFILKPQRIGCALLLSLGLIPSLLHADFGFNRLSANVRIPTLIVASDFSDITFTGRRAADFQRMVDSRSYPTLRSQVVIASTGRLDIDLRGTVEVTHPITYAEAGALSGTEWRTLVASRALIEYSTRGAEASDFDRNGDGVVQGDELVILNFNATPSQSRGGLSSFSRPFELPDGTAVGSLPVILLGDYATLSDVNHEFLHNFGATDIYGPTGATNLQMSVMANSGIRGTLLPDPWHRIQFGWNLPQVLDLAEHKDCGLEISQYLYNPAGSNLRGQEPLIVIDTDRSRNEYFIIEHRSNEAGESGIELADRYTDTGVAGTGVVVWSTQVTSSRELVRLTSADDVASVVDWGGSDSDVAATLAVSEDGSRFGSGDMIWDQLGNEQQLRWFNGDEAGISLNIVEVSQRYSRIGMNVEATGHCLDARRPFPAWEPAPELDLPPFPDPGPWTLPHIPELVTEDTKWQDPVINPGGNWKSMPFNIHRH